MMGKGSSMRPQSIVWFERLYLISFVLGLVSTWQNWAARADMLRANEATANLGWLGPTATVIGLVIALTLLYLVARRANVIAKWIVVVFAAWGAVLLAILLLGLVRGTGESILLIVGVAQNLLYLAAAVLLFRPDARAWFGETAATETVA